MENWPAWAQYGALILLLCCSAFFSISETSMMALNRNRLKHLAKSGHGGARNTQQLLARTDELLSVILIGNNLVNTVIPVLTASLAVHYFGNNATVLSISTATVAFMLIVFCEITPKIIGATYPERIAFAAGYVIRPLISLTRPLAWFVNLFVSALLKLTRINTKNAPEQRVSPEELRTLVLESGNFIPHKHRSILLNLLDLDDITVDDVMTPRARVEMLDLARPLEEVLRQLETCYHNNLPVCDGDADRVAGILHVRKALSLLGRADLDIDQLRTLLVEPYYIPSGTPVLQQLQYFQENQRRLGLIVNEYGEVQGLVTLQDIIEEMIGEFTTTLPTFAAKQNWNADGTYMAEGGMTLRELNRKLGLQLPLDGPKTLNGLILDTLEEIPDESVCVNIAGCRMEILQIDQQIVRTVRLRKPVVAFNET